MRKDTQRKKAGISSGYEPMTNRLPVSNITILLGGTAGQKPELRTCNSKVSSSMHAATGKQ